MTYWDAVDPETTVKPEGSVKVRLGLWASLENRG